MEVVTSLEVGADDYVRLPCDLTEIMVRIWALLRRVGLRTEPETDGPISSGRLVISPCTYEVFMDDRRAVLTSTEFRLLHLLVKNRGTVVAHQTLERAFWGGYMDSSRLVKKYVQRLRRKLGDHAREPVWIASAWYWIPIHWPALGLSKPSPTHDGIDPVCNPIARVNRRSGPAGPLLLRSQMPLLYSGQGKFFNPKRRAGSPDSWPAPSLWLHHALPRQALPVVRPGNWGTRPTGRKTTAGCPF